MKVHNFLFWRFCPESTGLLLCCFAFSLWAKHGNHLKKKKKRSLSRRRISWTVHVLWLLGRYKYKQTSYRHRMVPRAAWRRHTSGQENEQPFFHTQGDRIWDCDASTVGPWNYAKICGFPTLGPSTSNRLKSLIPVSKTCRWVRGSWTGHIELSAYCD